MFFSSHSVLRQAAVIICSLVMLPSFHSMLRLAAVIICSLVIFSSFHSMLRQAAVIICSLVMCSLIPSILRHTAKHEMFFHCVFCGTMFFFPSNAQVNNSHYVFFGDPSVYDWDDDDGTKAAHNWDRDGSLTGTPNTYIVRNRPFFTGPECLYRPDWHMSVCPYRYIKVGAVLYRGLYNLVLFTLEWAQIRSCWHCHY